MGIPSESIYQPFESAKTQAILCNTEIILLSGGHGKTVSDDRSNYLQGMVGSILGQSLLSREQFYLACFFPQFLYSAFSKQDIDLKESQEFMLRSFSWSLELTICC